MISLCGQPRRWITSAGLSPVALAPTGGHQMTPEYYTDMSCFAQTSAVDRQTLSPGGAQSVERSMTKADAFREYAEEALQWSRQSSIEEEKKALLDLACHLDASCRVEREVCGSAISLTLA